MSSNANVPFWEFCNVFAHPGGPKKEQKRWSRRGRIPPCPYGTRKKCKSFWAASGNLNKQSGEAKRAVFGGGKTHWYADGDASGTKIVFSDKSLKHILQGGYGVFVGAPRRAPGGAKSHRAPTILEVSFLLR